MRAFIALSGIKPVGEKLSEVGDLRLGDPIRTIGVLVDYVSDRIARQVSPEKISMAHPDLSDHADSVSDQVSGLRDATEKLLRTHRQEIIERQFPAAPALRRRLGHLRPDRRCSRA